MAGFRNPCCPATPRGAGPVRVRLTLPPGARARPLRIAMVGRPNSGKSTVFDAVASTGVQAGELAGTGKPYRRCRVQIGIREVEVVDLPGVESLCDLEEGDREALKYLLWGDHRPEVSRHEPGGPPAPFSRPDVLIQILDASKLATSLQLTLELAELGLPMVVGLNMMDEARRKGMRIDVEALTRRLGVPLVAMVAPKGQGIPELFAAAVAQARDGAPPRAQPSTAHIAALARRTRAALGNGAIHEAFRVPEGFLLTQLMKGDRYFSEELSAHLPRSAAALAALRAELAAELPRGLAGELRADLHHRAATLAAECSRQVHGGPRLGWEERLDALFLHPRWGLVGASAVLASVLVVVFEVSAAIDQASTAPLLAWVQGWQPAGIAGVAARAAADGLAGLLAIALPYMFPLVLLLVLLEECGVMQRIAFVLDRFLHRIGLHGNAAVPLLLGLGCNVPAIAAARSVTSGRERIAASLLILFVPCSARTAIVLAVGGKYLGGLGVLALLATNLLVIALLGRLLLRRFPEAPPGVIQPIPPYTVPRWGDVMRATWARCRDVLTLVLPLLVVGSIGLALLQHLGATRWIDATLAPLTVWLLGLPVVLGVPLLFGVLRKELSVLMLAQALGTSDVGAVLDWRQLAVLLVFVMLYVPCVSTFAALRRAVGRREAWLAVGVTVVVAVGAGVGLRGLLALV